MHALFILLALNLFGLAIIQSNFFHFFFFYRNALNPPVAAGCLLSVAV